MTEAYALHLGIYHAFGSATVTEEAETISRTVRWHGCEY
jgi:hypothetical protein